MTEPITGRSRLLMVGRRNMCTGIFETARMSGSAKRPQGWLSLAQASFSCDHPCHASLEYALNIDFFGETGGGGRVAVEPNPESAMNLVQALFACISRDGVSIS